MLNLNEFYDLKISKIATLTGGASEDVVNDDCGQETSWRLTVVCDLAGLNNSKEYGDWTDDGCCP